MLDPTILLNLQASMPPARPDLAIERAYVPPLVEAAQRRADRTAREYEISIADWIVTLQRGRSAVEAIAPVRDMTESELATFAQIIEDIEYEAELRGLGLRRFVKKADRAVKHWFSIGPSLGAIVRSLSDRLSAADETAIEELLEHALYVRAFRSDRDPSARGGPTFDDGKSLGQYLRQAVTA